MSSRAFWHSEPNPALPWSFQSAPEMAQWRVEAEIYQELKLLRRELRIFSVWDPLPKRYYLLSWRFQAQFTFTAVTAAETQPTAHTV